MTGRLIPASRDAFPSTPVFSMEVGRSLFDLRRYDVPWSVLDTSLTSRSAGICSPIRGGCPHSARFGRPRQTPHTHRHFPVGRDDQRTAQDPDIYRRRSVCIRRNHEPGPSEIKGLIDVPIIEPLHVSTHTKRSVTLYLQHERTRPDIRLAMRYAPVTTPKEVCTTSPTL